MVTDDYTKELARRLCPHGRTSDKDHVTLTLTPSLSDAAALAADRFARNCRALGISLPMPALDFCLGRDGSATAKRDGRFLAGCSVPRRAAEVMVRKESWKGRSLCLLVPTHAQQIAVVLDRLGPTRALIVVPSSPADLADFLACIDFTAALDAGRLFFAEDEAAVDRVFAAHPGLPVPAQMVRLPDVDTAEVARVTPWVQATLSRLTIDQGRRVSAAKPSATPAGWCVLAGRQFRPWADAGDTLAAACDQSETIDTDRATTASEAFLAERAAAAAVVVTADRPRPKWATSASPWITWLTKSTVPPFNAAYPRDALLLTDGSWMAAARNAGWPANRLAVAGWPALALTHTPGAPLALIYDLPSLAVPEDIAESSGRQLVWEAIQDELPRDPFAVGEDAAKYIRRAPARLGLEAMEDFPVDRYIESLVGPAYVIGIAKWLAAQGVAFTIHGRGWEKETALADRLRGPLASREAFSDVVAASGGLIDPFLPAAHPLRSTTAPRVATFGSTPQRILQDIKTIDRLPIAPPTSPLSRTIIESLVR
ncbi:MAG: hypothetical protein JWM57_2137 [Phycisphaerales bacterium]|nr:hypothetical protein [Phycisphaerales bacterium]